LTRADREPEREPDREEENSRTISFTARREVQPNGLSRKIMPEFIEKIESMTGV